MHIENNHDSPRLPEKNARQVSNTSHLYICICITQFLFLQINVICAYKQCCWKLVFAFKNFFVDAKATQAKNNYLGHFTFRILKRLYLWKSALFFTRFKTSLRKQSRITKFKTIQCRFEYVLLCLQRVVYYMYFL